MNLAAPAFPVEKKNSRKSADFLEFQNQK